MPPQLTRPPDPPLRPPHRHGPPPCADPGGRTLRASWVRRATGVALLALGWTSAPPSAVAQQPSFGPLTWEHGAPLQRMAYTPVVEPAEPLGEDRWSVELYNGYSNIFEQDSAATHVLFVDMERLTTALTVRRGVSGRLELGGRATLESTGAGFLDETILAWHHRWGFGQANRDRFPQNAYRQLLSDGQGRVFLDRPAGTLKLRDLRAFAKWAAWRSTDGRSLLSLRSVLRIPTIGPLEGNGRPDGALMALWRQGIGDWYAHGILGFSVSPASPELAPVLRGHSGFLSLAVERSLGATLAAVVQLQVQTAQLRSFHHRELDRAPTNLLLGVAGTLGESWTWDAALQEDVPADTPAADFTVTLRIGRRW